MEALDYNSADVALWCNRKRKAWIDRKKCAGTFFFHFTVSGVRAVNEDFCEIERDSLRVNLGLFAKFRLPIREREWGLVAVNLSGAIRSGRECRDFCILNGEELGYIVGKRGDSVQFAALFQDDSVCSDDDEMPTEHLNDAYRKWLDSSIEAANGALRSSIAHRMDESIVHKLNYLHKKGKIKDLSRGIEPENLPKVGIHELHSGDEPIRMKSTLSFDSDSEIVYDTEISGDCVSSDEREEDSSIENANEFKDIDEKSYIVEDSDIEKTVDYDVNYETPSACRTKAPKRLIRRSKLRISSSSKETEELSSDKSDFELIRINSVLAPSSNSRQSEVETSNKSDRSESNQRKSPNNSQLDNDSGNLMGDQELDWENSRSSSSSCISTESEPNVQEDVEVTELSLHDQGFIRGWDDDELANRPVGMTKATYDRLRKLNHEECCKRVSFLSKKFKKRMEKIKQRIKDACGATLDFEKVSSRALQEINLEINETIVQPIMEVKRVLLARLSDLEINEMTLLCMDNEHEEQDSELHEILRSISRAAGEKNSKSDACQSQSDKLMTSSDSALDSDDEWPEMSKKSSIQRRFGQEQFKKQSSKVPSRKFDQDSCVKDSLESEITIGGFLKESKSEPNGTKKAGRVSQVAKEFSDSDSSIISNYARLEEDMDEGQPRQFIRLDSNRQNKLERKSANGSIRGTRTARKTILGDRQTKRVVVLKRAMKYAALADTYLSQGDNYSFFNIGKPESRPCSNAILRQASSAPRTSILSVLQIKPSKSQIKRSHLRNDRSMKGLTDASLQPTDALAHTRKFRFCDHREVIAKARETYVPSWLKFSSASDSSDVRFWFLYLTGTCPEDWLPSRARIAIVALWSLAQQNPNSSASKLALSCFRTILCRSAKRPWPLTDYWGQFLALGVIEWIITVGSCRLTPAVAGFILVSDLVDAFAANQGRISQGDLILWHRTMDCFRSSDCGVAVVWSILDFFLKPHMMFNTSTKASLPLELRSYLIEKASKKKVTVGFLVRECNNWNFEKDKRSKASDPVSDKCQLSPIEALEWGEFLWNLLTFVASISYEAGYESNSYWFLIERAIEIGPLLRKFDEPISAWISAMSVFGCDRCPTLIDYCEELIQRLITLSSMLQFSQNWTCKCRGGEPSLVASIIVNFIQAGNADCDWTFPAAVKKARNMSGFKMSALSLLFESEFRRYGNDDALGKKRLYMTWLEALQRAVNNECIGTCRTLWIIGSLIQKMATGCPDKFIDRLQSILLHINSHFPRIFDEPSKQICIDEIVADTCLSLLLETQRCAYGVGPVATILHKILIRLVQEFCGVTSSSIQEINLALDARRKNVVRHSLHRLLDVVRMGREGRWKFGELCFLEDANMVLLRTSILDGGATCALAAGKLISSFHLDEAKEFCLIDASFLPFPAFPDTRVDMTDEPEDREDLLALLNTEKTAREQKLVQLNVANISTIRSEEAKFYAYSNGDCLGARIVSLTTPGIQRMWQNLRRGAFSVKRRDAEEITSFSQLLTLTCSLAARSAAFIFSFGGNVGFASDVINSALDVNFWFRSPHVSHSRTVPLRFMSTYLNVVVGLYSIGRLHEIMDKIVVAWLCAAMDPDVYTSCVSAFQIATRRIGELGLLLEARYCASAQDPTMLSLEIRLASALGAVSDSKIKGVKCLDLVSTMAETAGIWWSQISRERMNSCKKLNWILATVAQALPASKHSNECLFSFLRELPLEALVVPQGSRHGNALDTIVLRHSSLASIPQLKLLLEASCRNFRNSLVPRLLLRIAMKLDTADACAKFASSIAPNYYDHLLPMLRSLCEEANRNETSSGKDYIPARVMINTLEKHFNTASISSNPCLSFTT